MAGENNIAQYGIQIVHPNADPTVTEFNKVTAASITTTQALEKHAGGADKLTASLSRTTTGAVSLLRTLGPLAGGATELGIRLERAGAQVEKLFLNASRAASGQQALNEAFLAGTIVAATMEAAQARLTAARAAAVSVDKLTQEAQVAANAAIATAAPLHEALAAQKLKLAQATGNASVAEQAFAGNAQRSAVEYKAMIAAQEALNLEKVAMTQLTKQSGAVLEEERQAIAGLNVVTKAQATANAEVDASQKLVNASNTGIGFAGTAAIVIGLVVTLAALAAAFYTVKKAWDFFSESISAAGAEQKAEFPFQQMVGNATLAEEKLKAIHDLTNTQGMFNFSDLVKGAEQLIVLKTGADNLIPRLTAITAAATASGESIDSMTTAYAKTETAIENHTALMNRGMSGSRIILMALEADLGKNEGQIQAMFKAGEISITQVNKALLDAAKSGGIFGQSIDAYLKTWPGALGQLSNIWEQVKTEFGKPIASALAGVINDGAKGLNGLIPLAAQAGEAIAHVIRALALIGQEQGWQTALSLAWEIVVDKMAQYAVTALVDIFVKLGPALADGIWQGFWQRTKSTWGLSVLLPFAPVDLTKFAKTVGEDLITGITSGVESKGALLADAMKRTVTSAIGVGSSKVGLQAGDLPLGDAKAPKESDYDKFKTDTVIIYDYWRQRDIIEAKVTDETEKYNRILELTSATYKELYNPRQLDATKVATDGLTEAQTKGMEVAAIRLRQEKEIDDAIKNGTASTTDAILRGLEKAKQAFGNWTQAVEKATTEVANALSNDISTGLADIFNGTKSVSQGFTDMALSIITDIEKIIIKLEVEYLLQQLIGGISGGFNSGQGGTNQPAQFNGTYAMGGSISGGSGTKDDVPIMATAGEYMIRKDRVRSEGVENMHALNEGRATIVKGYASGGGIEPDYLGGNRRFLTGDISGYPNYFYGTPTSAPMWTQGSGNPRTSIDTTQMYSGDNYVDAPSGFGANQSSTSNSSGLNPKLATHFVPDNGDVTVQINPPGGGSAHLPRPNYDNEPSLFGGPAPATGGAPYEPGSAGVFQGQFNPFGTFNLGQNLSVPTETLNWGGTGKGSVLTDPGTGAFWNSTTGTFQQYNATTGVFDNVGGTAGVNIGGAATGSAGISPQLAAAGLSVVGYDPSSGQPIYQDAQGNKYAGPGVTGNNAVPSSNWNPDYGSRYGSTPGSIADLKVMGMEAYGGDPNNMRGTSDEGHTNFNYGSRFHAVVMPDGGISYAPNTTNKWNSFAGPTDSRNLGQIVLQNMGHYHGGGIVGHEGAFQHMAAGGQVGDRPIMAQDGEGVFTQGQMAALGAGMGGGNNNVSISINVQNTSGNSSAQVSASGGGMTKEEWVQAAEMMKGIALQALQNSRRFGGSAYRSQTGAGR